MNGRRGPEVRVAILTTTMRVKNRMRVRNKSRGRFLSVSRDRVGAVNDGAM